MPHADVNGQRLFYEDTGSGRPAVIWSHGLFMDRSMFDAQVQAFAGTHRCVTWDERGHGQTESTPDPFSYWDAAGDLLGLMDHLGIERAVLAGMSQGGFLSMRAALTAPERVMGLVLIDTQAGVEDPAKLEGYDALLEAWTAGGSGVPPAVADIVAGIVIGDPDRAGEWKAKWQTMDHATVRQVYATLVGRDDITDRLGELDVPALVVHATDDAAIELEAGRRLADGVPRGELAVIEGGGHASNMTRPDDVNPHIERFLAALREQATA
ncbi:MAG: alpha/beta fold hydrolase [Solirubrobacterales bacterium]|nr:alpha/beta fold hydrolase [Solirubrobacterales bacterium]